MTRAPACRASWTASEPTPPHGRVDQHGVAVLDPQRAVQHLVRGEAGQRQPRRGLEAQAQRFAGEGAHGGGDVLGEGATGQEVLPHIADDLVADGELVDGDSGLHDDSGDVPAGDHRKDGLQSGPEVALPCLPVDRVDGRGPHLHQNAVRADLGVGSLAVLQDVGTAVPAVADRLHHPTIRAAQAARNSDGGRFTGRQERRRAAAGSTGRGPVVLFAAHGVGGPATEEVRAVFDAVADLAAEQRAPGS